MKREIVALTSLRGVAAMLVVAGHWRLSFAQSFGFDGYTAVFAKSHLAVDFFFILSGFVLSYVHGDECTAGSFRYREFLLKRIARVYPLHVFTLAFLVAWECGKVATGKQQAFGFPAVLADLPANLLLVQSWINLSGTAPSWNGPSWSISAEWAAYLLFPVIFRLAAGRRRFVSGATAAAAAATLFVLAAARTGLSHFDVTGVIRCLAGFSLGVAVYRVSRSTPTIIFSDAVTGISLASAFAVMHFGLYEAFVVVPFCLLILSASGNRNLAARVLSVRPLKLLGTWSYSIYLVHAPMIEIFSNLAPGLIRPEPRWLMVCLFCLGLVLVLPVACITHYVVEKPGRRILAPRRRSVVAKPISAAMSISEAQCEAART